ncbi:hypothetical protein SH591_02820 [Sphingomonas sp. LY54]|uniref:hypothetical protein n=1 Tax=Sphingomonas sp. LY54 TaxID=3095343 RepID=UPI002D787F84|nr:hypothetical protein [Sphingomonas sp. LY54]WRP29132.1 hypothetical protein SH591_02820 [Sphingomonas sp. LY54]
MRLIELIQGSSTWTGDDTTIYVARPWSCDADATLISPAPDTTEPVEQGGRLYDYFLETFIAREVIEGFAGSDEKRCQRLIDYAENDA